MEDKKDFRASIPKFGPDEGDFGCSLFCPSCGSSWTHHTSVTVFDRAEDSETGRRTIATGAATTVDGDMTNNPSLRRDGLIIGFYCETCPTVMEMDISQHKGQTYFRIRYKTDAEDDPREF